MADQQSFFLTGANAKVVLNNKTVAYATNISYRIIVRHASPRVLGRFEVEVHQPLSYDVEGSLTVIKYGRGLKAFYGSGSPRDTNNKGSGVGSYKEGSVGGALGGALGLPSPDGQFDGAADDAFIPRRMFQSKMFDIEIRQKIPGASNTSSNAFFPSPPAQGTGSEPNKGTAVGKAFNKVSQVLNSKFNTLPNEEVPTILLRECRFTELDFTLSKKSAGIMTMKFKARYVDEDTFIAAGSGVGQELS